MTSGGSVLFSGFLRQYIWPPRYNWHIVKIIVRQHTANHTNNLIITYHFLQSFLFAIIVLWLVVIFLRTRNRFFLINTHCHTSYVSEISINYLHTILCMHKICSWLLWNATFSDNMKGIEPYSLSQRILNKILRKITQVVSNFTPDSI